ncbi:4-alpha-glucanotransferase [Desulfovibrio ferrophilus]|uniref:4-alpha-glucanotransferase n=1 Tax=Desulfovibrio ferrophilus TaxID=241368 RepID=A0A2Z6B1Z0_9BACT|nr:4-alpha-glucanotransferase [Desulfovibrio ferrophilus]BBD09514.1 putative 4-alpha-glucanotransferase [Desulfovibrio ferrophilus]
MLELRSAGILLHLTSLPSAHGIGGLGPEAYEFADFLEQTGQRIWQILPLTPTSLSTHNDPYHSISAFAGNPLLISLEFLLEAGWLTPEDIAAPPIFPEDSVDFAAVTAWKEPLLNKAFNAFEPDDEPDFQRFCTRNHHWLDDYALFSALRQRYANMPWTSWPEPLRDRNPEALVRAGLDLGEEIQRAKFLQWVFDNQWESLRAYCAKRRISLFGDMPIYVDMESADLWANPNLWKLDEDLKPTVVAGVPPDYFSATGQLWESPIYDWDEHEKEEFKWWLRRIHRNLDLFDFLRIDHFRGLIAFWEVPAGESTAMNGEWVEAPVCKFLDTLYASRPSLPLIAEDLGVITPDVRETMRAYNLPGMKILLFAFGDDLPTNPYAPHNIEPFSLVYTGTHDNNPVQAWYDEEADAETRDRLVQYIGHSLNSEDLHWALIRMALGSPARLAVIPVQDLLGLGAEARMNRPGNLKGNWHWRMKDGSLTPEICERLRELTRLYGRE